MTQTPKGPLWNPDHTPVLTSVRISADHFTVPSPTHTGQHQTIAPSPSKGPDLSKPGIAFTGNPRDPGREEPARWEQARK